MFENFSFTSYFIDKNIWEYLKKEIIPYNNILIIVGEKSFGKEADCMVKCDQTDMVFTAYITLRNGNRLYAKQVGKKVFCFPRKEAKEKNDK